MNSTRAVHCLLALVGIVGCWLEGQLSFAHETVQHEHQMLASAVHEATLYRPTLVPDRIVLTWNSNPATSVAVSWRTSGASQHAVGEIALADGSPHFGKLAKTFPAQTSILSLDQQESALEPAKYHSVEFTGLQPATKYAYRVGDGQNWSEWSHITTASADSDPFTFIYVGDAQNDLKSRWSRVIREAYADAPRAAFILHAGDLINSSSNDAEWGAWFYSLGHIHRTIPCIATPGNHEYGRKRKKKKDEVPESLLSPHWKPTFTFPLNGPAGLEESVYWLDYQGTRIVSLNSNERIEEQAVWLDKVLAENHNRWTIVTCHHPIYSGAEGRDNKVLRDSWQPVFDRHQVDIVLQGHDHTYARTELMTHERNSTHDLTQEHHLPHEHNLPSGITAHSATKGGTMYVVSVSGPKMYELEKESYMRRAAENVQLYQIITVDEQELRFEARTAIGKVYDAFTLRKRKEQSNELIEHVLEN